MNDEIKVTKVTFDKGYGDREPIVLSGEGLIVTPCENGRDFVIWADMRGGESRSLFKTSYGFEPKETEFSDAGELDLGMFVTKLIENFVSRCKNVGQINAHMLEYNIKGLPDFVLDYADIYAERISQNASEPTSFKKMLLKGYQKEMADLFMTLRSPEEKEKLIEKVRFDVEELSEFFDEREAKKQEEKENFDEFNSIFEEAINE